MNHKFLNVLRKTGKIFLWIIGAVIALLIVILILLNIPAVQNKVLDRVEKELSIMTGTEISVERIGIYLPAVSLKGIYVEGPGNDTLLYAGELKVTANLTPLLDKTISIESIRLSDVVANVSRADTTESFNFQFILDSLSSGEPSAQTGSPWDFRIDEIFLNNIRFELDDHYMNQYGNVRIGAFHLNMDTFDMSNLDFYAENLSLRDSRIVFRMAAPPAMDSTTVQDENDTAASEENVPGLDLKVEELVLTGNTIVFTDSAAGDHLEFDMGEFAIRDGELNMEDQAVYAGIISLAESRLLYRKDSSATLPKKDVTKEQKPAEKASPSEGSEGIAGSSAVQESGTAGSSGNWRISLDELALENNRLSYHDERYPEAEEGLDMNHLDIQLVKTSIADIKFDSTLHADINRVVVREEDGLSVENLAASVFYSAGEISVENFKLETPNSSLNADKIQATDYLDLNAMDAEARLQGHIGTEDIVYLLPSMKEFITGPRDIGIDVAVIKNDAVVNLGNFSVNTDGMSLKAEGTIKGLEGLDKMQMDQVTLKVETSREGLRSIVPPAFLPDSLTIPSRLTLVAGVDGTMDDLSGNVNVNSTLGDITISIKQDSLAGDGFRIDSRVNVNQVRIGSILNNPQLGIADLDIALTGEGRELMQAAWEVSGTVNRLDYSGYAYEDISLEVFYDKPDLRVNVSADQPALAFNLEGNAILRDSFPSAELHLDLEKIDFDSLNLWTQDMIATARIDANLDSIQTGRLNGSVGIRDVAFLKNDEVYEIDSLLVASIDQEDNSELTIDSDLLRLDLKGNIPIMKIPEVVIGLMNRIILDEPDSLSTDPSYHLKFDLELYRNELLSEVFVPDLKRLDLEKFTGELDENEDRMRLDINIPVIEYGGFDVYALSVNADTESDRLNGHINVGQFQMGDLSVTDISLSASTYEDHVLVNAEIPKEDTAFFRIVSEVFRQNGSLVMHLVEDSLILNGEHWTVNPENRLFLGTPMQAENFELQQNDQSIRIAREQGEEGDSVTVIDIDNFNLAALGHIFDLEAPLINGTLSSDLQLSAGAPFPSGNLGIDSLALQDIGLGNLSANIENITSGISLDVELAADTGSLTMQGSYLPENDNRLDLTAGFRDFSLQTVKPVLGSMVETLEGKLNGELSITGTTSSPAIGGDLNLNNVRVFPVMLGTTLTIDDETIHFEKDAIRFDNFTITDADNQEATLDGTVQTENFQNIELDLNFNTKNFMAFNSEEASEDIPIFGKVILDTDLQLKGSPAQLKISGSMALKEESELNLVIPGTDANVIERETIVNFIDVDSAIQEEDRFQLAVIQEASDTVLATIEGMDISLNISIEENSRLKVIIDQQTGENLSIQGQGDLSFQMQPNGNMNLSGRYNISEGQYFLNFQGLVKREFNLLDESYIEWIGKPMEANLNLVAEYTVETQPPVGDITEKLPFNVVINIGGEIMSPELNFSISMPEEIRQQYQQVAGYINDINGTESELNKQVMSLVLFKSFMTGRDAGGSGLGIASTARASISKFLTQQLNRLSSGIEGFNVTFNLDSYETQSEAGGQQGVTNLEVGVSQSLFSDRLTVKVSGDVYLEGAEQQSRESLKYVDDVSLEYELTESGNFLLVGFRENEYDGISQGEIIRTGVGIIFSRDYDDFSDLFKRIGEQDQENRKDKKQGQENQPDQEQEQKNTE